jgi:hypothetical protein
MIYILDDVVYLVQNTFFVFTKHADRGYNLDTGILGLSSITRMLSLTEYARLQSRAHTSRVFM